MSYETFYEIRHSDGDLIQRIPILTRSEIRNLEEAGFAIKTVAVDTSLVEWLRPIAWQGV